MPIYEELPFIASKTQIVLTSCIFPTVVQISRRVKRTTTSSLEENNKKKWSKKDVRQLDSTLTQLTALLDLKGIREFHVTPFVVVFELSKTNKKRFNHSCRKLEIYEANNMYGQEAI